MAEPLDPANQPSSSADAALLALVPDHQLIRIIGKGSSGDVWLARNALGSYRAVKLVFLRNFRHQRPFDREFKGVQKFEPLSRSHDGLVDILQVGRNDAIGCFYCVMELADDAFGNPAISPPHFAPRTLAHDISVRKRLPVSECIRIGIAISSALQFLHSRKLIHRDVKPSNIVFVNGIPKLADIGLVAEMSEARSYVGTDGFIPPEGPGSIQADIYSLGKVLYEISTGKDRHDYPDLPTQLEEAGQERDLIEFNKIVLKACRSDPRERYCSTDEMLRDLHALQQGRSLWSERRKQRLSSLAVAAGLCAAIGGTVLWRKLADEPDFFSGARRSEVQFQIAVPAPSGMVGWWPGEENAHDIAGGHHGRPMNRLAAAAEEINLGFTYENVRALMAPPAFSPGIVGQAFNFDGRLNHIRIPDHSSFRLTNALTIEAWIFPLRLGVPHEIVSKWDMTLRSSQKSYTLALHIDGTVYLHVSPSGTEFLAPTLLSTNTAPVNRWSHVAGTYDGAILRIFLNGELENEMPYTLGIYPGTNDLAIGGVIGGGLEGQVVSAFDGRIDEPSIYNRALSPDEVRAIFHAGVSGKSPKSPLLLAR